MEEQEKDELTYQLAHTFKVQHTGTSWSVFYYYYYVCMYALLKIS